MKIVAISGMIGTGKTTLAVALSQLTGWTVVREDVSKNQFLGLFYDNMERWALASQLSFMLNKTQAFERCIKAPGEIIIIDRTLQEDFYVFGSVLKKYEIISKAEYQLLENYYGVLNRSWLPIDLNIYLEDTDENCFQRLLDRGDALESKVEIGYVKSVGEEYRRWRAEFLHASHYELKSANLDFRQSVTVEHVLEDIRLLLKLDTSPTDSVITSRL
jgi:deoxyadenosine/deoxycytidine kinase